MLLIYIGVVSIVMVWAYLIGYVLYVWNSARKQNQHQDQQEHIHRA